jgi:glycosyltransferase A (GT-A) superfamily protein (DUF2064 family)
VIGPGQDGGYYLLGLPLPGGKTKLRELFLDIQLGGPDVLEQSRRALPGAIELPPWPDVDELTELESLTARLAANPALAPALAETLLY